MPTVAAFLAIVVTGAIGVIAVISSVSQPGGHLRHVVAEIGRPPLGRRRSATRWSRTRSTARSAIVERIDPRVLRLLGIDLDRLLTQLLLVAVVAGFATGSLMTVITIGDLLGGALPPWSPVVIAALVAVATPLIRYVVLVARARAVHIDLRHQLAGFLDVVTIVVAGNIGHEGALRIAADSGRGRLFSALRHRMRESTMAGRSAIDALYAVGGDLGLDELGQVAATIELAAIEGSPVVRTLSAACATVRSALAAEQEAEARLRTSRLTAPLIGMALIFMGLVVYPALGP